MLHQKHINWKYNSSATCWKCRTQLATKVLKLAKYFLKLPNFISNIYPWSVNAKNASFQVAPRPLPVLATYPAHGAVRAQWSTILVYQHKVLSSSPFPSLPKPSTLLIPPLPCLNWNWNMLCSLEKMVFSPPSSNSWRSADFCFAAFSFFFLTTFTRSVCGKKKRPANVV